MTPTEEHFLFLDSLRESGVTNMFGASPYIIKQFNCSRQEAKDILKEWIRTFTERHKNA